MKIQEILSNKGHTVETIGPGAPVSAAVRLLVQHGIGSVVVMDEGEILGILTERDILRLADRNTSLLANARIGDVMTTDLIVAFPTDDVSYAMEVMTRNRVRHLPVVEDGTLHGIISIGDVVNAVRRHVEAENRYLREYVQGVVR